MKSDKYLPYVEARNYVRQLNLKSEQEYLDWWKKNKPDFLPEHPDIYYSKPINTDNPDKLPN